MEEWLKVIFDGIGTEIISLVVGLIIGGVTGFKIGKRKSRFSQSQNAGDESEQRQKGTTVHSKNQSTEHTKSSFRQSQKAGNSSKQTQIGDQKDV